MCRIIDIVEDTLILSPLSSQYYCRQHLPSKGDSQALQEITLYFGNGPLHSVRHLSSSNQPRRWNRPDSLGLIWTYLAPLLLSSHSVSTLKKSTA